MKSKIVSVPTERLEGGACGGVNVEIDYSEVVELAVAKERALRTLAERHRAELMKVLLRCADVITPKDVVDEALKLMADIEAEMGDST